MIYYASWQRKFKKKHACIHCSASVIDQILITTETMEPLDIDDKLDYAASTILDAVNRDGLTKPTDFTFSFLMHCWRVYEEIKSSSALLQWFLRVSSHRALFCKLMDRASCVQTFGCCPLESNVCVAGHDLNTLVAQRFFNSVAKNLVKDLTNKASAATASGQPSAKKRKIAKLQSSSQMQ